LCNLTITQATHPQNQARKKHISFASRQCKATLQCTNLGCYDKPEIHSGSTPSLQPRFGTVRLLVVPKIEGDVKRSTFFIGCRSWGSCAQMDQQPTRNFLHGQNEQMDIMTEKMCSCKWWLCWKISVQYVREINFFHFDITVIILPCQKLISYNWRPYLSITPRILHHKVHLLGKKYFDCRNVHGMSNKKWSENILVLRVHSLCLIMGLVTCVEAIATFHCHLLSEWDQEVWDVFGYMFNSHLQNHYPIHCAVFAVMEHKNMYSIVYNSQFSWETCNNITLDTFKIKSHGFFTF